MIYDAYGREIQQAEPGSAPIAKRLVMFEAADRYEEDASRALTPSKLDAIFRLANAGDSSAQARLAMEIEEKDFQAAHALSVRRAAATGLDWTCRPPRASEKDTAAGRIAEAAEDMLRSIRAVDRGGQAPDLATDMEPFAGLIEDLLGGLLPGYAVSEILWQDGGRGIDAFVLVPTSAVTFRDSQTALLASRDHPNGAPLVANKFVFHRHKSRSGDVARGGLIRPLGWMYCFGNLGIKDLLRFVERYGMPFLLARLDENAWQKDRSVIASLVRNFGSDGGGVFSKSVEAQLLDGAGSGGDVYFRLLEFFGDWKTRTVLGQTATSGDAKGFSNGGAQAAVRQDILESDCSQLSRTIRRDILRPWAMWNFGPEAVVPEIQFEIESPQDLEAKSKILVNLQQAGFEVEAEDVEKDFGMRIRRKPDSAAPGALALSDARGTRVRRRALALTAQAANEKIVEAALQELGSRPEIVRKWVKPVQEALDEALSGLPESGEGDEPMEALKGRLEALLENLDGIMDDMDTGALEDLIARAMFAGDTNGRIQTAAGLK